VAGGNGVGGDLAARSFGAGLGAGFADSLVAFVAAWSSVNDQERRLDAYQWNPHT
jgi:hypothetical protein